MHPEENIGDRFAVLFIAFLILITNMQTVCPPSPPPKPYTRTLDSLILISSSSPTCGRSARRTPHRATLTSRGPHTLISASLVRKLGQDGRRTSGWASSPPSCGLICCASLALDR
jgi:hypothetical protein